MAISRRELIAGAGLAGLGAITLGSKGSTAESTTPSDVDVVVVGAGAVGKIGKDDAGVGAIAAEISVVAVDAFVIHG